MTIEKRIRGLGYNQWLEDTDGVPLSVEVLSYDGGNSTQAISAMLGLAATAGSSTSSKYLAAIFGEVHGGSSVDESVALAKTDIIVAGVIGKHSHVGTSAATYKGSAVRGEIGNLSTSAYAAILAVMGGDNGTASAGAAFGVDWENSTPASRFNHGLDLEGSGTHDDYIGPRFNQSFIRMGGRINDAAGAPVTVTGVCILAGTAAPTDGASGTGVNVAGPGSLYIRQSGTDSKLFIQTAAAITSMTWVSVGGQS